MSTIATCPSCQARLAVPEVVAGRKFECPRCHSAVDVGDAQISERNPCHSAPAPKPEWLTALKEDLSPPAARRCAVCGQHTQPDRERCGHCNAPLASPVRGDLHPRRKSKSMSYGVALFAVIGFAGLACLIVSAVSFAGSRRALFFPDARLLLVAAGMIGICFAIGALIAATQPKREIGGNFFMLRALYYTLATIGFVISLLLLFGFLCCIGLFRHVPNVMP